MVILTKVRVKNIKCWAGGETIHNHYAILNVHDRLILSSCTRVKLRQGDSAFLKLPSTAWPSIYWASNYTGGGIDDDIKHHPYDLSLRHPSTTIEGERETKVNGLRVTWKSCCLPWHSLIYGSTLLLARKIISYKALLVMVYESYEVFFKWSFE